LTGVLNGMAPATKTRIVTIAVIFLVFITLVF
jgi:hypothetical protein